MGWSSLEPTVPAQAGAEREARLLALVEAGQYVHRWFALQLSIQGRTIELEVSEDALAVGDEADSVRINVNATTAQRIADKLGALLLTPKLSDLIHREANCRLAPSTRPPGPTMASTAEMVAHSRSVDLKKAAAGGRGLCSNVGKDWVLTNRLLGHADRAANYGWQVAQSQYPATLAGLYVLQPIGLAHNRFHVDYSQVWRGVRATCSVDGQLRPTAEVLADPLLAAALSHEGPLQIVRQPGVPAAGGEAPGPVRDPLAVVPRALRRGMQGADVAAWQRVLGLVDDGIFGRRTEEATKSFQQSSGLVPDGIVGPVTRAAANRPLYPFVEAKNKRSGRLEPIELVVLHTMEADERPDTAERVAAWFAGPNAPMASAHYCVDADSIVQCVKESDTAFHAPGANSNGIGIEHAGYARQTPEDWADAYSQTMLRRSAELTASLCKRHGLPVEAVDVQGLLAKRRGITTHHNVSLAFRKSTHTDPGKSFPMESYLEMVREYLV